MKKAILIAVMACFTGVAFGQTKPDSVKKDTTEIFAIGEGDGRAGHTTEATSVLQGFFPVRTWSPAGKNEIIFKSGFNLRTIMAAGPISPKTGKMLVYIHKSQIHWINDSTFYAFPYRKPIKHRVVTKRK